MYVKRFQPIISVENNSQEKWDFCVTYTQKKFCYEEVG